MTIISREKVREAYERALAQTNDSEAALAAAAQAHALPVEAVAECLNEAMA